MGKQIYIVLLVFVLVCTLGFLTIFGRASTFGGVRAAGQITVDADQLFSISYRLRPQDPSHLQSVFLFHVQTSGDSALHEVMISLDAGTTWVECHSTSHFEWRCDFSYQDHHIADLTAVEVVVD